MRLLGELHFIVKQEVFSDQQYVCVKCGKRAYDPEILFSKPCTIKYLGDFGEVKKI